MVEISTTSASLGSTARWTAAARAYESEKTAFLKILGPLHWLELKELLGPQTAHQIAWCQ